MLCCIVGNYCRDINSHKNERKELRKTEEYGRKPFLESGRPSKVVAFEIRDGSENESTAVPCGRGSISGVQSNFGSVDLEKTLTELALSELEVMARTKADETGPNLNVGAGIGFVRESTVGSSNVPTAVKAARTK